MNVLLDTNILLDILVPGRPCSRESAIIFQTARQSSLEAFMTTQSILDAAYVVAKSPGYDPALFRETISGLLRYINIHGIDSFNLRNAIRTSEVNDIEDCSQIYFANEYHCSIIITSDRRFPLPAKLKGLTVLTPQEFVSHLK